MGKVPRAKQEEEPLSRRERQLMDVIYRRGATTARGVMEELPDAPGYSTVRTLLGVLVRKGWLKTQQEGKALSYRAAKRPEVAAESALRRVVRTFFNGSLTNAVSGLMSLRDKPFEPAELAKLEQMIKDARKDNRP